jgi:hypothetical protein
MRLKAYASCQGDLLGMIKAEVTSSLEREKIEALGQKLTVLPLPTAGPSTRTPSFEGSTMLKSPFPS